MHNFRYILGIIVLFNSSYYARGIREGRELDKKNRSPTNLKEKFFKKIEPMAFQT